MTHPESWHAERRLGIGASDGAAVMAQSKWKSPYMLYLEKVQAIEPGEAFDNEAAELGSYLELSIAKLYAKRTGNTMRRHGKQIIHGEHEFMRCHVDGWAYRKDPTTGKVDMANSGVLEVKNVDRFVAKDWDFDEGIPPIAYAIQMQHMLACTGRKWGAFAVLVGGNRFHTFEVERDNVFIEQYEKRCGIFWGCVQNGIPPEVGPDDGDAIYNLHPVDDGETVILPEGAADWTAGIAEIGDKIKDLTKQRDTLRNRIKQAIGDNTYGSCPGMEGRWSYIKHERRACKPLKDIPLELHPLVEKVSEFRALRRVK